MTYKTVLLTRAAEASPWPAVRSPIKKDAAIESNIDQWLSKMSLEQKVGQMVQAEIKSISPDDAAKYHIGSILNGGGSWPTDKPDGPLAAWSWIQVKAAWLFQSCGAQMLFMVIIT